MQINQIFEHVRNIGEQHHAEEVILFGSRAAGTAQEKSDIDLAVSGAENFDELAEEIRDIPTLYSFDVVNLDTCRNQTLVKEIRTNGKKIL